MATYQELLVESRRLGVSLQLDQDCQCYRATAPDGKCFDPGLHELIAVFGGGVIGNGGTKAEAREDMLERLRGYDSLSECRDVECVSH